MSEVYQMTKEELFKIYPDKDGLTEEKAKLARLAAAQAAIKG